MAHQRENRTSRTRNAFTLAELLVVIVIILLLVGLLMPVLGRAYRTALKSADSALIGQIALGCQAYNEVFHEYPTSEWYQTPLANNPVNAKYWWPPYPRDGAPHQELVGAAKVFATLSGFNTLPEPAVVGSIGCGGANHLAWSTNCGQLTYRGILTSVGGSGTEDKVYGPYYQPNEKNYTKTVVVMPTGTVEQQMVFASRFQRLNPPPLAGGEAEKGAPILYYRAIPAASGAATTPTAGYPDSLVGADGNGTTDSWEIYRYEDNYPITDKGLNNGGIGWPSAPADRAKHPLYAPSDGLNAGSGPYNPATKWYDPTNQITQFWGISKPLDKSGATPAWIPNNANTFILITPGPDGEYFTEDDVTNFK